MRKVRRFQAKDVSRAAKGGFGATLAVALLVGGLASFIAPAISSAAPAPTGSTGAITYSVTPAAISFPTTAIGSSSTVPVTITAISFNSTLSTNLDTGGVGFYSGTAAPNPSDFSSSGLCDNAPLAFLGPISCTENVTFTPTQVGSQTAVASFSDSNGDIMNIAITAVASGPDLVATPGSVNFGNVVQGTTATQNVTVKNIGDGPANITDASTLGADANFHITSDGCSGIVLNAGDSCVVGTSFENSSTAGAESNTLTVNPGTPTASNTGPLSVPLAATSIVPPLPAPGPTTISPTSAGFGIITLGASSSQTIVVANQSTTTNSVYSGYTLGGSPEFSVTGGTCSGGGGTLTPAPGAGSSCTIIVSYTASTVGAATGTITVTFSDGQPTLTSTLSATGAAQTYAITNGPIDFGDTTAGGRSMETDVTIYNNGPSDIALGTASITGPEASDFGFGPHPGTCTGLLAPGQSCILPVVFKPAAGTGGELTATLTQPVDGGALTPLNVGLQGNATAPKLTITPDADFGSVPEGTSSPSTVFTIKNVSGAPIQMATNDATVVGFNHSDFKIETDGCSGVLLQPGQTCQVSVEFQPSTTGPEAAELVIQPQSLPALIDPLTGIGLPPTTVTVSPGPTFNFGSQQVGTTSVEQQFTVKNTGTAPLVFFGPAALILGSDPADFVIEANGCFLTEFTGGVAPGGSCTVDVVYSPTVADGIGPESATLGFLDNSSTAPDNVVLSGTATPAPLNGGVVVNPTSFNFGNIGLGNPSAPETFTVTNTGTASEVIGPDTFNNGEFAASTDNCTGVDLSGGQSCTITVLFTPNALGAQSGTLTIGVAGFPGLGVALFGNGIAATSVTVAPNPLNFGNQAAGTASLEQAVVVTNTGTNPLVMGTTAPALAGDTTDFTIVGDSCTSNIVAPGFTCQYEVIFNPAASAVGPLSASFKIADNAGGAPQTEVLTGTATPAPVSGIVVSPPDFNFGAVGVGNPSAPATFTVSNVGTTPQVLGPNTVTGALHGDFVILADNCEGTLNGGQTCTITVVFTPSQLGGESATLNIPVGGSPTVLVPMFGSGAAATSVTVAPNPLNFGNQPAGTASSEQTVTVTNTGTNPLIIGAAPTLAGDATDFSIVGDGCSNTTIAPGFDCTYEVIFQPATGTSGALSANFTITDNAGSGKQIEVLNGNATNAPSGLVATPSNVAFGNQGLFLISPEQVVTVTNNSGAPVTIGTAAINGNQPGDFPISGGTDHCSGVTLDPGQSCSVGVSFDPSLIGPESAELDVTYGTNGTLVVPLTGTGVPPATDSITVSNPVAGANPIELEFGSTSIGTASDEQYVTITNTEKLGGSDVHVFFQLLQGAFPGDFNIVSNTCSGFGRFGIAPQQVCVYGITFNPQAPLGANPNRDADLIIKDNTNGDAQTVHLHGTAEAAVVAYTVTPNPMAFGTQATGTTSAPMTATVTNITPAGGDSLVFPTGTDVSITGAGASQYTVENDLCSGATVAAEGSLNNTCTVDVVFNPTITGTAFAQLLFKPTNGIEQEIQLTGTGVVPGSVSFGSSTGGLNYGQVIVNTTQNVDTPPIPDPQIVTITNTSATAGLVVSSLSILGTNASDFAITGLAGDCGAAPFTIAIFQSCQVTITFTPSALGARAGFLNVVDNAPASPQTILLNGVGVPERPIPGYWLVGSDGGVFAFGAAHFYGSLGNLVLNKPIVGMAATADGKGYWLVASDGGVFTFGDAAYFGSTGNLKLNSPIVGMAASPDGLGYWLVAADGGIFSFGDAHFWGSVPGVLKPGQKLNSPVVAITKTVDGGGYLMVAADGGVFAFGDATFHGSAANYPLNKPINALVITPPSAGDPSTAPGSDGGYLMSASDGGLFAFGNASFLGSAASLNLKKPIVGMDSTIDYGGYWQVADDGGVFSFGDANFKGSTGDFVATQPNIVGLATDPVDGFPG